MTQRLIEVQESHLEFNCKFIVIGKLPKIGFSKTRLAADVGEEKALEIYQEMLFTFFKRYKENCTIPLNFWATPKSEETKSYFNNLFHQINLEYTFNFQKELPFFQRLKDIFQEYYEDNNEVFLFLTGTDIPDFPFDYLKDVKLNNDSVTIGPDPDGGFYFLATQAKNFKIFDINPEGSQVVLNEILIKAEMMSLEVTILDEWSDVDTIEDYQKKF